MLPILLLSSMGNEHRKTHEDLFKGTLTKPVKEHLLRDTVYSQCKKCRSTE